MKGSPVAIAVAAAVLAAASSARAEEIVVVSGDDLQAALDRAGAGDRVVIDEGTHRGTFVVRNDGVEVVGTPGARLVGEREEEDCPIALRVEGDDVTVRDVPFHVGGVRLDGRGVTLERCTFRKFTNPTGHWNGVVEGGADGVIADNTFGRGCRAAAAILVHEDAPVAITGNRVEGARTSSGIVVWSDGSVVEGNDIAMRRGGRAIEVRSDDVAVSANAIAGSSVEIVGHRNRIERNRIERSPLREPSLHVEGDVNVLDGNEITAGEDTGVIVLGDRNRLAGNSVVAPGSSRRRGDYGHGFLVGGSLNVLEGNEAVDCRGEGFGLHEGRAALPWSGAPAPAGRNVMDRCTSTGAGSCGLGNWAQGTSVVDSTFTGNAVDVISDAPFTTFSGNTWETGGPDSVANGAGTLASATFRPQPRGRVRQRIFGD